MTTNLLISDLKRDEGLRLEAYPDPLSGGAPWTIGYGHTGPDVTEGLVWEQPQADGALESDAFHAEAELDEHQPWWRQMDDLRQDVLANMTFNLGIAGVSKFHDTLAAMQAGDYEKAAACMLDSMWAEQVGARADRLAEQMKTGIHQD